MSMRLIILQSWSGVSSQNHALVVSVSSYAKVVIKEQIMTLLSGLSPYTVQGMGFCSDESNKSLREQQRDPVTTATDITLLSIQLLSDCRSLV